MKKICCLLFFSGIVSFAFAQQPKTASSDAVFSETINKVVLDFTHNFINIQGGKIPADVDADAYKSNVCVPGALGCKIMRYHSVEDKSANWQAGLYEGESFAEALKMYKKVFGQLKKTPVKGIDNTPTGFDGKMESVDENVGFAVCSLRLKTKNKLYKSLVAEVEITSNYTGWEVHLNIYTKTVIEEEKEEGNMQ